MRVSSSAAWSAATSAAGAGSGAGTGTGASVGTGAGAGAGAASSPLGSPPAGVSTSPDTTSSSDSSASDHDPPPKAVVSNRSVVSVVGTSPVSSSRIAQSNGRSVAPVDAASSAPCRRSSSVKLGGSLVGAAGAGGRTFPTPRGCATGPVGVGAGAGACEPVARPSQSTSLRPWPNGSARRRSSSTARFSAARSSRWRIAVGSEIEDGCEAVLVGGTGAAGGIRSPSVSRSCSTAACGFSEGSRSSVSIRIAWVAPASSGPVPLAPGTPRRRRQARSAPARTAPAAAHRSRARPAPPRAARGARATRRRRAEHRRCRRHCGDRGTERPGGRAQGLPVVRPVCRAGRTVGVARVVRTLPGHALSPRSASPIAAK